MILEFFINKAPIAHSLKDKLLANIDKLYFLFVGACAAGVHWTVASIYFYAIANQEYIANLLGFILALAVSVIGHTFFTFRYNLEVKKQRLNARLEETVILDKKLLVKDPIASSAHRKLILELFAKQAIVGVASFALNNIILYAFTWLNPNWYAFNLLVTLILVAVFTFLISKYGIYRGTHS